jgi:ubiquinone/menaquinone biosynthesis C-methylase UbiE
MNNNTQLAVQLFDTYAQTYQQNYMDVGLYHDALNAFCQAIPTENASILELACGPGNITQHLLRQRPDFNILATDLSPNMIALAQANNPQATCQLMDIRDVDKIEQTYDAVLCGFGLPYLTREEAVQWIADAAKLLGPGGVLYVSAIEDDYSKSGFMPSSPGSTDGLYQFYHQRDHLSAVFEANGLNVIYLESKSYQDRKGRPTTDLMMVGKK